jgi:hypothetical protein
MFKKGIGIGIITLLLGLGLSLQAREDEGGQPRMSKREQRAFQEGNQLLRQYKYYEAAEAFSDAGREGQGQLNNIMNNFKDIYEAQKNEAGNPKSYDAALSLANLYHQRWKSFIANKNPLADAFYNLAVAEYETATKLNGSSVEPYQQRGDLNFDAKKWDLAITDYQKVLAAQSNNPALHQKLAQCYFEKGSPSDAEKEAKTALAANAQCGECAELLGQLEDKKGNTEGAFKYYQLALQKNPRLPLAQRKVNEIIDAKTPKGFIKITLNTSAAAEEMYGISDVDDKRKRGVSVSAGSYSSSSSHQDSGQASASGSYDTSKYGSGSGEVSGQYSDQGSSESSGQASSMSGTMYSQRYACRPGDTQVIAYNTATKRQYALEDGIRTPLPAGSYVLYAAFRTMCDKQFGEPYMAKEKTVWKKPFTLQTGQYFNLEVFMKAGMLEKECSIDVKTKKEQFDLE